MANDNILEKVTKKVVETVVEMGAAGGIGATTGGMPGAVGGVGGIAAKNVAEAVISGAEAAGAIMESKEKEHIANVAEKAVEIKAANPDKPVNACYEEAENEVQKNYAP